MVFFPWFSLCFCVLDFVAYKDGIKFSLKNLDSYKLCKDSQKKSHVAHFTWYHNWYLQGPLRVYFPHFKAHILWDPKKKIDSSWNKLYLLRKKEIFWNLRERYFRNGKNEFTIVKQNPKIHREKQKEKWAKQAREKETLTFTISSARAFSRLLAVWWRLMCLNILRNML